MCTPSVQDSPVRRPLCRSTCPIMRTVDVFPFVPVTETTGIRAWLPGGYRLSSTAPATSRGVPSVGDKCMRKPGHAAGLAWPVPGRVSQRPRDIGETQVDSADVQAGDGSCTPAQIGDFRMHDAGDVTAGA